MQVLPRKIVCPCNMFSWLDNFHRPFTEVMDNSAFEVFWFTFEHDSSWSEILVGKKAGSFGLTGSISLPNIWITDVMVGLSSGCCCTHNRLTWMHRSTSETTHESFMLESINSKPFCSFQSVHAWNMKENMVSYSCSNSTIDNNKFVECLHDQRGSEFGSHDREPYFCCHI